MDQATWPDMGKSLTILGGGPCGLYAAHTALTLGAQVTLFEKESRFGGLAAGNFLDENWYDFGVHMLHAFDQRIFRTCALAMASERIEVALHAQIKWCGKNFRYPLRGRDILAGMPPLTLARCLSGLFLAELQTRFHSRPPGEHAESALIEIYGEPLYHFFFRDFTHQYWGIHPRDLSAEFVRRKMPRLSAVDVFKNLFEKLHLAKPQDITEGALRFETLHYSHTGSETLPRTLAASLQNRGAILHLDSPIQNIFHEGHRIKSVESADSQSPPPPSAGMHDTKFLSTIPLPQLIQALIPRPPNTVLEAADRLRFKPMTVYALRVNKPRCMDAHYTYYRDRIFHRVGEPKNAGLKVTPAHHTTLIVETTCEMGDDKWNGKAFPQIVHDLEAEELCKSDEIVSHHLLHATHAYPIFSLGFESSLCTILSYLRNFNNLQTCGRQGSFTYPNMHEAMRMGATAATDLLT